MDFRIFKSYKPEFTKCISCGETGSLKKYRSRGIFDRVAKLFFFKRFFCKNCQWKGRYFTLKLTKKWHKVIFFYIIIIIATIIIIYNYLEKFI